jgi:hypothetical protein
VEEVAAIVADEMNYWAMRRNYIAGLRSRRPNHFGRVVTSISLSSMRNSD